MKDSLILTAALPEARQLLLLLIGFLLTSGLGGLLGYLFQTRTWDHQQQAAMRRQQAEQGLKTYEEISTLLDKRLYRMKRLYWAANRKIRGDDNAAELDAARSEHREVLYDWNDNLNRMLALVQTYFGGHCRQQMVGLQEDFASVGRALRQFVDASSLSGKVVTVPRVGQRLDTLSNDVYRLNVRMLQLLQDDQLGRSAPKETAAEPEGPALLDIGAQGAAVRQLQRALRRSGQAGVDIDGQFGPATADAVRSFQAANGLVVDSLVGPRTWAALPTGVSMPVLQEGVEGDVVARLQASLNKFAPGRWELTAADNGTFGHPLALTVEAFQRYNGLKPDGVVGARTWAAALDESGTTLESAVGLRYASPG